VEGEPLIEDLSDKPAGYIGSQHPALADLDKCTRCGLCEQACPTYRLLHFEPDSPRGRIFLMKEVAQGRGAVDANLAEHLYACLGCRACETACPSGVPFGRLLEYGRHQVELHGERSPALKGWRRFRTLAFEHVLPTPWLFNALLAPARLLQEVPGALALAKALPLPKRLRQLVRMIPPARQARMDIGPVRPGTTYPAQGERRARVGLFVGCVMGSLFGQVHEATIRVLTRNGCEVVVVPGQWCCGALNLHAGERTIAAKMARTNVAAFGEAQLDAIVVNSAGCGAVMKEYGELLADDPAAHAFSSRTLDISEFLAALGLRDGLGPLRTTVTYQDACHLAHGQRVRTQPRMLIEQIPGIEFVELAHADRCCGAAGVYSLTHPAMSSQILAEKIDAIVGSGAHVVATSNPGCSMQILAGLAERGLGTRVCHVVELLDESYARA
jgi:glycolate dehydrogenase iron-sulfur subunit